MYIVATIDVGECSPWYINVLPLTVYLALNLYKLPEAYVWLRDPAGPVFYFFDTGRWGYFANGVIFCVITCLGDALVVSHSCYAYYSPLLTFSKDLSLLHNMGPKLRHCYPPVSIIIVQHW